MRGRLLLLGVGILLMGSPSAGALPVPAGCAGAIGFGAGPAIAYVDTNGSTATQPALFLESGARPGLQDHIRGPCYWPVVAERDYAVY